MTGDSAMEATGLCLLLADTALFTLLVKLPDLCSPEAYYKINQTPLTPIHTSRDTERTHPHAHEFLIQILGKILYT